ncbi:MAG: hypothetical protein JKY42_09495 [Flavobacteriales bacterium]|nr:hypothetical protein [Flavobacteriales bacterium]
MKKLASLLLLYPFVFIYGQVSTVDSLPKENLNWYSKSPKLDKIQGVGVNRAYAELLKDKKSKKTIIVAVIDAGIDITHEDLATLIWINEDEIIGNGKDDDNNGYIDDINGWNFLGNTKGENINEENLEVTRITRKFSPKFEGKTITDISTEDKASFEMYAKANQEREELSEKYEAKLVRYSEMKDELVTAEDTLAKLLEKQELTLEDVQNYSTTDSVLTEYKNTLTTLYTKGISKERLERVVDYYSTYTKYYTNLEFTPELILLAMMSII